MADLKNDIPTKLLWLDLEMTGLDPAVDRNLEVAAIATDFDFNELGRFEAVVRQDPVQLRQLLEANEWYRAQPAHMQLFIDQNEQGIPEPEVERGLAQFIDDLFRGEPAVIAGNSIHNDRLFIKAWWPEVQKRLHYRMVDVSSYKIIMQAKYGFIYEKHIESHRALDDIQESIDELKAYLEWGKAT